MKVNDIIKINDWKRGLRIKAISEDGRWIIASSKAFGSSMYSIIDTKEMRAGTDNYVFGIYEYANEEDCKKAMNELENGTMEIGRRNACDIKNIYVNGVKINEMVGIE